MASRIRSRLTTHRGTFTGPRSSEVHIPSILNCHCAALRVPYTGNAAGHNSTTDLSGLKVGPYPQRLWHSKGIGAMAGCVLAALFGMLSVVWYVLGGGVDEGQVEKETSEKIEKKERRKEEAKGIVIYTV